MAVSENGQFAYTANENLQDVSAYTIDAITGALTPVTGSPIAVGAFPVSVTTTAPAKKCKRAHEEDRSERGAHDEQGESRGREDDERQDHFKFDREHGCHDFGKKDFEQHDGDEEHERERER